MKKLIQKFSGAFVLLVGVIMATGAASVDAACVCWFHQPEIPEEMKKLAVD